MDNRQEGEGKEAERMDSGKKQGRQTEKINSSGQWGGKNIKNKGEKLNKRRYNAVRDREEERQTKGLIERDRNKVKEKEKSKMQEGMVFSLGKMVLVLSNKHR